MSIFDTLASAIMPPETPEERAQARRSAETLARGPEDWLSLALDHHREIEQLFEQARSGVDAAARQTTSRELATILTAHANAEESALYPMLAEDHKGHAAMAYQEQAMTKIELHKLEMLDPMSQEWLDKLEHIRGAVLHHMYEEESTWFPELREVMGGTDDAMHAQRFRQEFERFSGGGSQRQAPLQMAASMDEGSTMQAGSGSQMQDGGRSGQTGGSIEY
jgi:hemerythrin superfamily protein